MVSLVDTGLSDRQITRANEIYNTLKDRIETQFPDQFIAIDPISSEYWINKSLATALREAKNTYPDRLFFSVRIGQPSAITFST